MPLKFCKKLKIISSIICGIIIFAVAFLVGRYTSVPPAPIENKDKDLVVELESDSEKTCEYYTPEGWQRVLSNDGKWSIAAPPGWFLVGLPGFQGHILKSYLLWPPGIAEKQTFPLVDDWPPVFSMGGLNVIVQLTDQAVDEVYKEIIESGITHYEKMGDHNVLIYYVEGLGSGYIYVIGVNGVIIEIDTSMWFPPTEGLLVDFIESIAGNCQ